MIILEYGKKPQKDKIKTTQNHIKRVALGPGGTVSAGKKKNILVFLGKFRAEAVS